MKSFLKWAGGKTRTAETLAALAPPEGFETYIEPFCGSAAVFFVALPDRAVLADANEDLIVCLQEVARDAEAVMVAVDSHPKRKEHYLAVRSQDPTTLTRTERAARTLYLNKMAFRGLWRVNRSGQFNVPWGNYETRRVYDRDGLLLAASALQAADIRHDDFREILLKAEPGDWVYLDPPYVPDRAWGDFTRYTSAQFGPADQRDLAELCAELDRNDVRWLLTNSDTKLVRELYAGFSMHVLPTRRDITLQSADRESVDLVVANYVLPHHDALAAA